jgi:hypothetical protein
MTNLEPVAHVAFAGGPVRPVFEDGDRQYVIDDVGNRVYGVWFVPRDDADTPLVVDTGNDEIPF